MEVCFREKFNDKVFSAFKERVLSWWPNCLTRMAHGEMIRLNHLDFDMFLKDDHHCWTFIQDEKTVNLYQEEGWTEKTELLSLNLTVFDDCFYIEYGENDYYQKVVELINVITNILPCVFYCVDHCANERQPDLVNKVLPSQALIKGAKYHYLPKHNGNILTFEGFKDSGRVLQFSCPEGNIEMPTASIISFLPKNDVNT